MKIQLFVALFISVILLSACGKDEEEVIVSQEVWEVAETNTWEIVSQEIEVEEEFLDEDGDGITDEAEDVAVEQQQIIPNRWDSDIDESVEEVELTTEQEQLIEKQVAQKDVGSPASSYKVYDPNNLSGTDEKILFFHASWCPSCVAADANFSQETELAVDSDIYKVDYDSNQALREQYGVNAQHTFILIDENGNQIRRMVGATNSQQLQALYR